jgi:hypothetical protein
MLKENTTWQADPEQNYAHRFLTYGAILIILLDINSQDRTAVWNGQQANTDKVMA